METWFIIIVTISIFALLKALIDTFSQTKKSFNNLPPSPFTLPIIGNFLLMRKSLLQLSRIVRPLHAKLGPIITLPIGFRPTIFVSSRSLTHQALIENGAVFASRPQPLAFKKIFISDQLAINAASYGPTWRLLRRNLTAGILHPSRLKSFMHARKWVLKDFIERLKEQSELGYPVCAFDDFQHAMFSLLVLMCFGDKLNQEKIKEVMEAQHKMTTNIGQFKVLNFWPSFTKIILRKRWEQLYKLREDQEVVLRPLIKERRKKQEMKAKDNGDHENVIPYVDSLLNLELPDERRKLEEDEIISLCSEFLNAGSFTSATTLEWAMANLVKNPHVQEKLFLEIKGVVKEGEEQVQEDDLQKLPYLKAIILETLRRHPPTHVGIPHAVTEDVTLDGFLVPKDATIYFCVADMGWDSKVWEEPMAFKPERFLSGDGNGGAMFDITSSREIKMIPFGAGRRICPGMDLALLHLEYFVANLVWCFELKALEGDEVNMVERQHVMVVMKNPLKVHIFPRVK